MFVYTITNVESGKVYVGKSKVPRNRWARHKLDSATGDTMLYRAMRKHGVASFKFEIVEQCASDEESFETEKRWVAKLESNVPGKGYNHTEGGAGSPRPDQVTRGRMGSGMRGKKQTPESVAKRVAANRGNGKKADKMARIRYAHSLGLGNNQIAARVGCTVPLVARYLSEMGLRAHVRYAQLDT